MREAGCVSQALDDLTLSARRLDQVNPSAREHGGKDQPGEAGARPQIRDPPCGTELRDLETGEAVGDVHIHGFDGVADGGGRVGLRGKGLEEVLYGVGRGLRVGRIEPPNGLRDRFT
jgi:hypothetical protein